MSGSASILPALNGWIKDAASGWIWLADAPRARRTLRMVEGPDGLFRIERLGGRANAETILEGVAFGDAGFAPALMSTARAALRNARVEILLQSRHFLVRPLELPAQAAPFLEGVVRTQIDRITPWRPGDAAFGASSPDSVGPDRILTQVVAAPRARLLRYAEALAPYGVSALAIATEVESAGKSGRVLVLSQSPGDVGRLGAWSRSLQIWLAAACLTAVAAVGAWSYYGLSIDAEREHLQEAISAKRAVLLPQRKSADHDAMTELDGRKRAALPDVLTLETLSKILPDGTYVTELSLEPGKAALSGVTDDAPGLIRLIEQSRQFTNATFSAPTTRSPNEAGERFHIEAKVEPVWVEAP